MLESIYSLAKLVYEFVVYRLQPVVLIEDTTWFLIVFGTLSFLACTLCYCNMVYKVHFKRKSTKREA